MATANELKEMTDVAVSMMQGDREQRIVSESMRDFRECQLWRNTTAGQWEEIAEILDPNSRNTFFFGNVNYPGQKKTERQIDSNGMLALEKFKAICDSLLTPRNMFWHALGAEEHRAYLMKDRKVRLWYESATSASSHIAMPRRPTSPARTRWFFIRSVPMARAGFLWMHCILSMVHAGSATRAFR
jgi:hypothetical protein